MPRPFLRNLQLGFGISLIILLASSTASYISIKQQIDNREKVDHTRRLIAAVNDVLIDLQNAETGQRGYHLTGKESFLEPYRHSLKFVPGSLAVVRQSVSSPAGG
jgi:CHASE3 domain sensor protein